MFGFSEYIKAVLSMHVLPGYLTVRPEHDLCWRQTISLDEESERGFLSIVQTQAFDRRTATGAGEAQKARPAISLPGFID